MTVSRTFIMSMYVLPLLFLFGIHNSVPVLATGWTCDDSYPATPQNNPDLKCTCDDENDSLQMIILKSPVKITGSVTPAQISFTYPFGWSIDRIVKYVDDFNRYAYENWPEISIQFSQVPLSFFNFLIRPFLPQQFMNAKLTLPYIITGHFLLEELYKSDGRLQGILDQMHGRWEEFVRFWGASHHWSTSEFESKTWLALQNYAKDQSD